MYKMALLNLQLKCPKHRGINGESISVDLFHLALRYKLTVIGQAH